MGLRDLFRKINKSCAGAYRINNNSLLIYPESRTTNGLWIATEPYLFLDLPAEYKIIGESISHSLDSSVQNLPVPHDYRQLSKKIAQAAKITSYRKLVQSSMYCQVIEEQGGISIIPTHNGGTKGDTKGFHSRPENKIVVERDKNTELIGAALLKGFDDCSTIYGESSA